MLLLPRWASSLPGDPLLRHYFFEDAFWLKVGNYPSFFDLWLEPYFLKLPERAASLHP